MNAPKSEFRYEFTDLFNPVLAALRQLGNSGTVDEIEEAVVDILSITPEELEDVHRGSITKFSYRIAWARNYLKRYGLIDKSDGGVWRFTKEGGETLEIDPDEVYRVVKSSDNMKAGKNDVVDTNLKEEHLEELTSELRNVKWKEQLLEVVKQVDPVKFERLCQLLLRELGFLNVEVTKRTNDGGIDGKGTYRFGGVMSFHIVFQCKRYEGTVPSKEIRDFRGASIGRADKGLFITTGTFSSEARKEAQRDGAPPIDLIDGYELAENLRSARIGVETRVIEEVVVDKDWFKNF